jgi:hypothetical protein
MDALGVTECGAGQKRPGPDRDRTRTHTPEVPANAYSRCRETRSIDARSGDSTARDHAIRQEFAPDSGSLAGGACDLKTRALSLEKRFDDRQS